MEPAMKTRAAIAVSTLAATLVLAAPPALAAVETSFVIGGPEFDRGTTAVSTFINCVDPETFSDVQADATVTVTLTQGRRSVTQTQTFTCFGDDDRLFTFRGFHPGAAFLEIEFTACDLDNCDTSTFEGEVRIDRR
jgi:hypothetical protein